MSDQALKLDNPPIVEAVLDIECDMRPGWQLSSVEASAREAFSDSYPVFQPQYFQEHHVEVKPGTPPTASMKQSISAYQFMHKDKKQLVQCRVHGFSFNRLAPYTDLDDYLPEIERSWKLFVQLVSPMLVRQIQLRYINRIAVPLVDGKVDLDQYFTKGPRLPDEKNMTIAGFMNQIAARDTQSGHTMNIVLTSQPGEEKHLPIIFDNCVIASSEKREPDDWDWILKTIHELRSLKNRVFKESVTTKCLDLFQQP